MDGQNLSEPVGLKSTRQLFAQSLQIYLAKAETLLGITAVAVVFSIGREISMGLLGNSGIKYSILYFAVSAVFYLSFCFIWLLTVPSLIYAIKEEIGIREAYKKGLAVFVSNIWIYFLVSSLVLGGSLILIIPGILFSVWFSLAAYVLVFEERKGIDAVFKSKLLVQGKFWRVFLRFAILDIVIFILYLLALIAIGWIGFGGMADVFPGIALRAAAGYSLQFYTVPFFLIFGSLIYRNLAEIKKDIPYEEPSFGRKLKYGLPGFLGGSVITIVIGLVVVFFSLNILWGKDELPPDDRDLILPRVEISNEENAFYWLAPYSSSPEERREQYVSQFWPEGKERLKIFKKINWPAGKENTKLVDDMIGGKIWDEAFAKEIFEGNKEVFDDFDRAINSSYFQDPALIDLEKIGIDTVMLSRSDFRNISKLILLKAAYLFNQGKEDEAFNEAFKVIKFGHLLESPPGGITMIDHLLALAIKETGLEKMRSMIAKTNLPAETIKSYISRLETMKADNQGMIKVFKEDYHSGSNNKKIFVDAAYYDKNSKERINEMSLGPTDGFSGLTQGLFYLYKPNQTQRFFVEVERARINNANKTYYKEMVFEDNSDLGFSVNDYAGIFLTENSLGKILNSINSSGFGSFFSKKYKQDFSLSATRIMLALKAYKIENGGLPDSLSELVPKYFAEVPRDLFDGSLVRYSRENKIIYSVGQDLKDSGGKSNSDSGDKGTDDISYKIEF